jgi:hypothetical protein
MGYGNTHAKKHTQSRGDSRLIRQDPKSGTIYGFAGAARGNCSFDVTLTSTGQKTFASISGRLIKGPHKKRISTGMTVLLQKDSSSSQDKYYIIHVYTDDDVRTLRKEGELPLLTDDVVFDDGSNTVSNFDDLPPEEEEPDIDDL